MSRFFLNLCIFFFISSCNNSVKYKLPTTPAAPNAAVTDTYFGTQVTDAYRNFENLDDSMVQDWIKLQAAYTDTILESNSGRDEFISKMMELDTRGGDGVKYVRVTSTGHYFYLKKVNTENRYKLYYRNHFESPEKLVFDPKDFKENTENEYRINYIQPSWAGKYVVISMSYDGKELSEMVILDMNTGAVKNEIISNAWPSSYWGINWLPDDSGFTYLHFPVTDPSDENFRKNTRSVLYRVGDDPEKRRNIFGKGTTPNLAIKDGDYPVTSINSKDDKYIIGYLTGVDNFWDAYYLSIEDLEQGSINWKPLFKKSDKVVRNSGFFKGSDFIFKTAKDASNFKIASVNLGSLDFTKPKIIVDAFSQEIISDVRYIGNKYYVSTVKNGVEAKLYVVQESNLTAIALPKISGNISLSSKGQGHDKLWIYINGWSSPYARYLYNIENSRFELQNLNRSTKYPEFNNLVIKEVEIPSHDGVMVPLSIVYMNDTKLDGTNPVLMDGYGSYGDAMTPYFSPLILSFVLEGGILATAHVRGGGEKGEDWHKGGFKTTKSNSWKDFIACGEYLIKENYTSKDHLVALSSSAGGIMAGKAITERPDIFRAAVIQVGMLNPLRHESRAGGGGSNYKEYGTVKDSTEAMALLKMDPYMSIKENTTYPPVLLTAGGNDTRIPLWIPAKFAAKLQASHKDNIALLNVKYDSGHSESNNYEEVYAEWGNIFAFAFWQTGHPDFQPEDE